MARAPYAGVEGHAADERYQEKHENEQVRDGLAL